MRGVTLLPPSGRHALFIALAALALVWAPGAAHAARLPGTDPVIAAAGDISCARGSDGTTTCRDQATSDLLVGQGLTRVLGLGDQQYDTGALADFTAFYDPTWGRVKDITSPAPGNHDPFTSGYSAYFGARAPAAYYSYDIGNWHLISLDSNSGQVTPAQVSWLRSDLETNAAGKCVLAYWHHPRFSSGSTHGNNTRVTSFWTELYNANADLVLNGHEHNYERFAPQDPNGVAEAARGIREFVVGTGGKDHYQFSTPQPNSEVRSTGTYGVLELALRPGGYDWLFVPVAGGAFSDSGSGVCHSAADLSLTKSDSPDPVLAGQTLTYTLTARNDGPAGATGVTVTDNLPGGVSYLSATASQGSCSHAPGTVTCSLGTLARNASATMTITVRHLSGATLSNTASVQGTETDPANANNGATESTVVTPVADLSLAKSDSPDPVLAGQPLTYALTATNNGPSAAGAVTLTDDLPATATYESAASSQGSCSHSGGRVTCNFGPLANGATATAAVTVRPQAEGTIDNRANVQAGEVDPNAANNEALASTTVSPAADLSLSKSDSPDPAIAGQALTYTLAATNDGPSTATGVIATDTLPAGVAFQSASASQGSCSQSSGTVTCTLGMLASGAGATVTIVVRPLDPGGITNSASVQATEPDPDGADNQATADTTVIPAADLSLAKADSPDPVAAGEALTYTLTAANDGPSAAPEVVITDTLPAGVTFQSASTSQGICVLEITTVNCLIGSLAAGAAATVTIAVRPQAEGTITNTAAVESSVADPDSADNQATTQTTIGRLADISVTQSDSPDPVVMGELLTYSMTVLNAGPSDASGVTVSDKLPQSVRLRSARSAQGRCVVRGTRTVACNLGALAASESGAVTITVRPTRTGTLTNVTSVYGDQTDPSAENNRASEQTTVGPG
jgi:uncharacterized repeat protein (TIGR01451 family)